MQTFHNNYTLGNGKLRSQQPLMPLTTTKKKTASYHVLFVLFRKSHENEQESIHTPSLHTWAPVSHASAVPTTVAYTSPALQAHLHLRFCTTPPPTHTRRGWRARRVISLKRSVKVSPAKTLSLLSLLICWICAWQMSNRLRPSDCV